MRFSLEIDMDNAAFADGPEFEVARILHATATRLLSHFHSGQPFGGSIKLHDVNGNTVGEATVTAD